ncbi:MAG: flagellar basal-body MS-ring/collar protein FliF [Pseudomonadota bacterium]
MQQVAAIWQGLDARRRIIALVAAIGTFAAILALASLTSRQSMALLYAGLDGASAGEVLSALDQRSVLYEVRNDAIYVEAGRRDELRMALAGEGLPATGGAGYEILDGLSGFGTTAQMFDAAYWRAKEGELARTIAANPVIRSARVHIAQGAARGLRPGSPPKASVTVTTAGGAIPRTQASALRYLVASAVAGMSPEDVAVIDARYGLVPSDSMPGVGGSPDARAEELRQNVERLLAARVGPGRAVVEVSVEPVTDRESITERTFDPNGRVPISSETEEKSGTASDRGQGAVTVASNLPEGNAQGSGSTSQSQNSETRERINYEVSERTRELLKSPGAIRRLSVAVLVDGVRRTDSNGAEVLEPRPDAELAVLRDLVASAVGFDESRGDVVTVKSMPFEPLPTEGTAAVPGLLAGIRIDVMQIVQLAVLALVALVLGLFVLRPILTRSPAAALPSQAGALAPPLTGEIDDGSFATGPIDVVSDFPALPPFATPLAEAGGAKATDEAVMRMRRLIEERQDEAVSVLRTWMGESEGERA